MHKDIYPYMHFTLTVCLQILSLLLFKLKFSCIKYINFLALDYSPSSPRSNHNINFFPNFFLSNPLVLQQPSFTSFQAQYTSRYYSSNPFPKHCYLGFKFLKSFLSKQWDLCQNLQNNYSVRFPQLVSGFDQKNKSMSLIRVCNNSMPLMFKRKKVLLNFQVNISPISIFSFCSIKATFHVFSMP